MKRRIGLTQRTDDFAERGEMRDGLDQRWTRLLEKLGFAPLPLCNAIENTPDYLDSLDLAGVILTGGNDVVTDRLVQPPQRDRFEYSLLSYCLDRRLSVLGICRGMQIMNVFFHGRVSSVEGHVGTRHRVLSGSAQRSVNSFHNFGIRPGELGENLVPFVCCADGSIEAFHHRSGLLYGVMWHPEREASPDGDDIALLRQLFESDRNE